MASTTMAVHRPTLTELRAPDTVRTKTSRPRLSVPNQALAPGDSRRIIGLRSFPRPRMIGPKTAIRMTMASARRLSETATPGSASLGGDRAGDGTVVIGVPADQRENRKGRPEG